MTDLAALGLTVRSDGVVVATDRLEDFNGASDNAGRGADDLGRKSDRLSADLRKLGGIAGEVAGVIAGAFSVTSAIASARQFDAALAETATLLAGNADQMKVVEDGARSLSREFGGSATEQVQAYYQAISAGAGDAAAATKLLESANRLAKGGVTDVTTAVDVLTTATNAYKASGLTAAEASDALFVGMKAGKTTITELSAAVGGVLPLAVSLGVSFDETVAAMSALTTQGISTAESATGVRAALTSMIAPTDDAAKLAAQLGIEFSAAGVRANGFGGVMDQIIKKTGGNTAQIQQLFGSIEATTAALSFAGGAGTVYGTIMDQMAVKAGATSEAFDIVASSLNERLNVVLAQGSDLLLAVGQIMLTALVPALEAGFSIFNAVAGSMEVFAIVAAGIAATQIPLLITSLASATTGVSLMMVQFYAGVAASTALTTATRLLTGAIAALGGPIGLALGAVVSVGSALFLMGRRADGAGAAVSDLERELGFVPGAASGAATGLGKAGTAAYDAAGKFDDFTGAVGASRTALQLWFDDYMKATALPPITTPLGAAINPPGSPESIAELEAFLNGGSVGDGPSSPNAPTSSPRPIRAPSLLGEPDTGRAGSSGSSGGSSVEEYTEAQKRALEVISQVNTEAVTQAEVISALEEMHRSGAITADQLATAIGKVKEEMGDVEKVSFSLSDSLAGVFTDALTGAKNLNDGLRDLLKSMSSLFLNAAFKSFLGGIFPSIDFGGFRAGGGGVSAGKSYIVGERGPELFTPGRSGGITPNGAIGGGGTSVQINNYSGAPVREQRSRGPDGREYVKVIVGEELGSGGYDKQLGRYGATPARVKR